MKEKILKLRNEGKSYREIQKVLGCSRALISYYVNPLAKTKKNNRQNKNRFIAKKKYKLLAGGKCEICGYSKCLGALQFHHIIPSEKKFMLSDALYSSKYTNKEILDEMDKCKLICANCHAELHTIAHS